MAAALRIGSALSGRCWTPLLGCVECCVLSCCLDHAQAIGADRVGIRFGPNGAYGGMASLEYREEFTHAISEAGKV